MKIKVIISSQASAEGINSQGSEGNEKSSVQFEKIVKEVLYHKLFRVEKQCKYIDNRHSSACRIEGKVGRDSTVRIRYPSTQETEAGRS